MVAAADPFRRPPMVDIPWGEKQRWWQRTTQRLAEERLWFEADSLTDLGELVAQFVEGKLQRTPDHGGGRDRETVEIAGPLAHANRQGFVTSCSQPGYDAERGEERDQQRAAVDGWASSATVEKLRGLIAGTRLKMQVGRPAGRMSWDNIVNVSRSRTPEGIREHTHFGHIPGRLTPYTHLGRPDITNSATHVFIYDPEWGAHSLLWDRLGQRDWDNPTPPERTSNTSAETEGGWCRFVFRARG